MPYASIEKRREHDRERNKTAERKKQMAIADKKRRTGPERLEYLKAYSLKKKYHLKVYGMTLEDYNQMLEEQNHSCAICKVHKDTLTRALSVDHCHNNGTVRGLLCSRCNIALGFVDDSVETLASMIEYLGREV